MKYISAFLIVCFLFLQSCESKRIFECDCDKVYIRIETRSEEEESSKEFKELMNYMDVMAERGCECEETDGERESIWSRR